MCVNTLKYIFIAIRSVVNAIVESPCWKNAMRCVSENPDIEW